MTSRIPQPVDPPPIAPAAVDRAGRPGGWRGPTGLGALAVGTLGWVWGLARLSDNSFLWQWRTGELILDAGVPRTDPWSWTAAGEPWVAHSWLAQVLYTGADALAGPFAIRLLVAAATAALLVVSFRTAALTAGDPVQAGALTLAACLPLGVVLGPRPLVFGLLALAALVAVLERPGAHVPHLPLALAALLWLWGNAHGSWALGVGVIVLHVLGRWWEGAAPWRGREGDLLLGGALGVVALLANPYGWRLVWFPLHLLGRRDALGRIEEWQPPPLDGVAGPVWALWVVVVLVALLRSRSRRDLLVAVPFLVLGCLAVRNLGPAVLVTLPLAARGFALPVPRAALPVRRPDLLAAGLAALLVTATLAAARGPHLDLDDYPEAAFAGLEADGHLGARIWTTDVWAGWVIWRYGPEQPVFLDDRVELHPPERFADHLVVTRAEPGWEAVLDRYAVEVVVAPAAGPLARALAASPAWQPAGVPDPVAASFVRAP